MEYERAACISVSKVDLALEADNDENTIDCVYLIQFVVSEMNLRSKTSFKVMYTNYL